MKKRKYKCLKCNEVSTQDEINETTAKGIQEEIEDIEKIQGNKNKACFYCPKCRVYLDGINFELAEEYEEPPRFVLDKKAMAVLDTKNNCFVCLVDSKRPDLFEIKIQELLDLANR